MREIVKCPEAPTPETLEIARTLLKSIVDEFLALPTGQNLYEGEDLTRFFAALPPGLQRDLFLNSLNSSNQSLRSFARVSYAIHRPEENDAKADPLVTVLGILSKILGDLNPPQDPKK